MALLVAPLISIHAVAFSDPYCLSDGLPVLPVFRSVAYTLSQSTTKSHYHTLSVADKIPDRLLVADDNYKLVKGKVFPYSLPSVGPGADPGVQAVSPQVT